MPLSELSRPLVCRWVGEARILIGLAPNFPDALLRRKARNNKALLDLSAELSRHILSILSIILPYIALVAKVRSWSGKFGLPFQR